MDHLSAAQLTALRRLLEGERGQLRARQVSETDDANTVLTEPGDVQDLASDEARRTLAQQRHQHDEDHLREVEAALTRMDEGSYGVCDETGDEIPFVRLRAEPTTRYTVEAQEQLEQESARNKLTGHAPDERNAY